MSSTSGGLASTTSTSLQLRPTFDLTQFPTRPSCFQPYNSISSNASCNVPSQTMFDFLNITNALDYFQVYCLNPPDDSCAFGYCPNSDISGPAVRIATYVSTICLSVVVLYSPEDMTNAFYAQLLQMYSFLITAVIAIAARQLTRLHAIFVLLAVASPLAVYLIGHAARRILLRRDTRLKPVFGYEEQGDATDAEQRWRRMKAIFNRAAVLAMIPFWLSVFIIVIDKPSWFTQTACDKVNEEGSLTTLFFLGPIYLLVGKSWGFRFIFIAPFLALIMAWIVAVIKLRKIVFKKSPWPRPWSIWRKVTRQYPFLMFCTAIMYPSALWIAMLESGADFSNETFQPSYGQLLAVFVAVPPFISCLFLAKDCWYWFLDLTWVRYLTKRQDEPLHRQASDNSSLANTRSGSLASTATLGSYRQIAVPSSAGEYSDTMWMKDMKPTGSPGSMAFTRTSRSPSGHTFGQPMTPPTSSGIFTNTQGGSSSSPPSRYPGSDSAGSRRDLSTYAVNDPFSDNARDGRPSY